MVRMMLVAMLLVVPMARAEEKDSGDTSKWVGTWKVTGSSKDGKAAASADIKGKTVKITKDEIHCMSADSKCDMACTYTVDTSSKPCAVTMKCTEGEHKGKTVKGIAKLEGDTLRICFSKPDSDIPTGFKTKEGQCCITLERDSK